MRKFQEVKVIVTNQPSDKCLDNVARFILEHSLIDEKKKTVEGDKSDRMEKKKE